MSCGTRNSEIHLYTPMKAIRRRCLDCCCGSSQEVSLCPVHSCSLHPYRFGCFSRSAKSKPREATFLASSSEVSSKDMKTPGSP